MPNTPTGLSETGTSLEAGDTQQQPCSHPSTLSAVMSLNTSYRPGTMSIAICSQQGLAPKLVSISVCRLILGLSHLAFSRANGPVTFQRMTYREDKSHNATINSQDATSTQVVNNGIFSAECFSSFSGPPCPVTIFVSHKCWGQAGPIRPLPCSSGPSCITWVDFPIVLISAENSLGECSVRTAPSSWLSQASSFCLFLSSVLFHEAGFKSNAELAFKQQYVSSK